MRSKSGSRSKFFEILGALVLLAGLGVGGYYLYTYFMGSGGSAAEAVNSTGSIAFDAAESQVAKPSGSTLGSLARKARKDVSHMKEKLTMSEVPQSCLNAFPVLQNKLDTGEETFGDLVSPLFLHSLSTMTGELTAEQKESAKVCFVETLGESLSHVTMKLEETTGSAGGGDGNKRYRIRVAASPSGEINADSKCVDVKKTIELVQGTGVFDMSPGVIPVESLVTPAVSAEDGQAMLQSASTNFLIGSTGAKYEIQNGVPIITGQATPEELSAARSQFKADADGLLFKGLANGGAFVACSADTEYKMVGNVIQDPQTNKPIKLYLKSAAAAQGGGGAEKGHSILFKSKK